MHVSIACVSVCLYVGPVFLEGWKKVEKGKCVCLSVLLLLALVDEFMCGTLCLLLFMTSLMCFTSIGP